MRPDSLVPRRLARRSLSSRFRTADLVWTRFDLFHVPVGPGNGQDVHLSPHQVDGDHVHLDGGVSGDGKVIADYNIYLIPAELLGGAAPLVTVDYRAVIQDFDGIALAVEVNVRGQFVELAIGNVAEKLLLARMLPQVGDFTFEHGASMYFHEVAPAEGVQIGAEAPTTAPFALMSVSCSALRSEFVCCWLLEVRARAFANVVRFMRTSRNGTS